MKGLTIQEQRVLIAILLALVIGAAVRYWRRQGGGEKEVGELSRGAIEAVGAVPPSSY